MKYIRSIFLTLVVITHATSNSNFKAFRALQRINSILIPRPNPLRPFTTPFLKPNADLKTQTSGLFLDITSLDVRMATPWGQHTYFEKGPTSITSKIPKQIYDRLCVQGITLVFVKKMLKPHELALPAELHECCDSPMRYAIMEFNHQRLDEPRELPAAELRSAEVIEREWREFVHRYNIEPR